MAIYVMSDIHGEYDLFVELLEMIKLGEEDDWPRSAWIREKSFTHPLKRRMNRNL